MENWVRTESRIVRPFSSIDEALQQVRFKLYAEDEFDERTSFDPPESFTRSLQPEFELTVDASAWEDNLRSPKEHFSLVIKLTDPRLHRSEIVFNTAIDEIPRTWSLPTNEREKFSWSPGFVATVALVLSQDREPEPGMPFLRGHWVARKSFRIRTAPSSRAFRIEPWTGDDFARNGLPRDTVYWIRFLAERLDERFDDPSEAFRVYLREDVYDALCEAERSSSGRAVLKLILAEILAEIIWRGLHKLKPEEDIPTDSLLHAILKKVEKRTGLNLAKLRRLGSDSDLASIRAYAQAAVDAPRTIARLYVGR